MKKLLLLVFFSIGLISFSQEEIETINGKKHIVHYVKKSETLYGIHRKYNVPIAKISEANKTIESGLKIGQKILIPIPLNDERHYQKHVIVKGETLYSISKKYQCSVADLKNLNAELVDLDIQIGQVIIVTRTGLIKVKQPVDRVVVDPQEEVEVHELNSVRLPVVTKDDTIVKHSVLAHETLYSIAKRYMVTPDAIRKKNDLSVNNLKAGDIILVPVKKVNYDVVKGGVDSSFLYNPSFKESALIVKKPVYKIALLLPLMYDANRIVMNRPIKIGEIEKLHPVTAVASEFYHGFMMAADSLAKAGLNAEIYIYDTKKDTNTIRSIFNKNDFSDIDMVVGPFFQTTVKYVAEYCLTNEIPMILPVNSNNSVLYHNPYVLKTTASTMSQIDGMIDFLVKDYSAYNICIVKPTLQKDKELYNRARDRYNSKADMNAFSANIVEIDLGSSSGRDWNFKLRKDTVNVIVVPSNDVKFVTSVFTRVNNFLNSNVYAKGIKVIVFGLEEWNRLEDIDVKHRMRTEQHYSSYRFFDAEKESSVKFIKDFRKTYGTEPGISAIQGFDVGFYFMSALYLYGENYKSFLDRHSLDLVQNKFEFKSISAVDGKENTATCIVKYIDYQLELISW